MCGEHHSKVGRHPVNAGSSPHVRGTLQGRAIELHARGIIPACAGNTPTEMGTAERRRDLPRMCGEHARRAFRPAASSGSSPHVRGTHANLPSAFEVAGIIPACAGNTIRKHKILLSPWDHPRMCGEHLDNLEKLVKDAGSSPHVRGTPPFAVSRQ